MMKKSVLFFVVFILFSLTINAQVNKSVECTAGSLSTLLSTTELSKVTNLTVSGTIDARDFFTMKTMASLSVLDLSRIAVSAYTGNGGPGGTETIVYQANEIPQEAFRGRYIQSISLPSSATSIGSKAFDSCSSLTSITIPSSVNSIGDQAFRVCTELRSINIPSSVTSIRYETFSYCHKLSSINIPSSVTSIGARAFYACGLTSIIIPPLVSSIENYTFYYCDKLASVSIPTSVNLIGNSAFESCSSLTSITIPSSVTSIGDEAFMDCARLMSINIPSSVTSIGFQAFYHCRSLTSINIPSMVKSLFSGTFSGCSSLTSISIPSSVSTIQNFVFDGCSRLTSVYSFSLTATKIENAVFRDVDVTSCVLYVPKGASYSYSSSYPWSLFKNIVEMDGLVLSTKAASLSAKGGTVEVDIVSENVWSVSSDANWLTTRQDDGIISLLVLANPTAVIRTATVTVSSVGLTDKIITVTQEAGTTGLKGIDNFIISIYPNPVTTTLYVKGLTQNSAITIFDFNGKMIISNKINDNQIDISHLSNGIYTIKIEAKSAIWTDKFVKQ